VTRQPDLFAPMCAAVRARQGRLFDTDGSPLVALAGVRVRRTAGAHAGRLPGLPARARQAPPGGGARVGAVRAVSGHSWR
jgi:hypothetical protein